MENGEVLEDGYLKRWIVLEYGVNTWTGAITWTGYSTRRDEVYLKRGVITIEWIIHEERSIYLERRG